MLRLYVSLASFLAGVSHAKALPVVLVFESSRYVKELSDRLPGGASSLLDLVRCDAPAFCSSLNDDIRERVIAVVGQPKNTSVLQDLQSLQLVQSTSYMYPTLSSVPRQAAVASYQPDWRDVYGVEPIAEFVLAAVFEWNYRLRDRHRTFSTCAWGADAPAHCPFTSELTSHPVLMNQTMGVLGYGKIGQAVARRSSALSMRTVATKEHGPFAPTPKDLVWLSNDNDELLRQSDFVILTLPGTVQNVINETSLTLMKPDAVLIPVSAPPVDYDALYSALVKGAIGGAVLDVWPSGCWHYPDMQCGPPYGTEAEPYSKHDIYKLDNVIALPGLAMRDDRFWVGSATWVSRNLVALSNGEPLHGVVRNSSLGIEAKFSAAELVL